jgi:DNA-binding SARP family transcriptional activator
VDFHMLGPLEVLLDGVPVEPLSPKQRALLIDLLVHHGQVVSGERLLEDLWADSPPATGLGVLQNYVSQLRKALGAELIATRGPGYAVLVDPGSLDSVRFEQQLAGARAALTSGDVAKAAGFASGALALWRGSPLADVSGEPFAQPEIARLCELRAGAVELEAECALAAGRHRDVTATLEARLAEDPLRERLWWLLMLALYRSGRQADALRAFRKARRLLAEELGIEPAAELRELEVAILRQRPELDWRAPEDAMPGQAGDTREPAPGPATTPPPPARRPEKHRGSPELAIVGRTAERAVVSEFLAGGGRSNPSRGTVLLLLGEPGIGKTRLLDDVRAAAEVGGATVVAGRAYEAERGRPYGAWVDAIRSAPLPALPEQLRADLAPLLPELSAERVHLEDRGRLYDAVVALLASLADAAPVLVMLDDIHWLDEPSAALLHFAARTLDGSGVLLAVAARPGELEDNIPCHHVVRALSREHRLRELGVGPLKPGAVRELVHQAVGEVDAARIVATGSGNPLLVLEMARALARGEDPLSGRLDALIADRLAALSEAAAGLIPWVATFGRGIGPALLAGLSGLSPGELLGPLAELERHGVLRAGVDGTYDLTHELVREVAYRRISPPRRTLLHGRIAAALAQVPDPDDTLAADAARHGDAGQDSAVCAAACLRAAGRCLRILAYAEAEAFVDLGRGHAGRLAPADRLRTEVALIRLLLHPGLRLRRPGQLASEIADLCADAQRRGLTGELANALHLLARVYHLSWGDLPKARALLARAADLMGRAGDQPDIEPLLETARCLALLEMDMPRAKELFDDLATVGPMAVQSFRYHWGLGLVLSWAGDTDGARAAFRQGAELAARGKDHWAEFECTARLTVLEVEAGRPEAALPLAEGLGGLVTKLGTGGSEAAFAGAVLALARLAGGEPGSREALADALADLERIDARYLMPEVLNVAAELDLAHTRYEAAARFAGAALDLARVVDRPQELARAHALLACLAAGDERNAQAARHVEAALAGDPTQLPARVAALVAAAREMLNATPAEHLATDVATDNGGPDGRHHR